MWGWGPGQENRAKHAASNPKRSLQPLRALTGRPDVNFRKRCSAQMTKKEECFKEEVNNRPDVARRPRRIRTEACPWEVARWLEVLEEASTGRWEEKQLQQVEE